MVKIAVFASGGGTNFQAIIDAIDKGIILAKLQLLLIDRENAYAKERAIKSNIPWIYIGKKRFSDRETRVEFILGKLSEYEIDGIVLAGFLGIIDDEIVEKYDRKILNIHPALIPKYCGKGFYGIKVHEAVIENKDKETGVTIHYVDKGIDTGEIIVQEKVEVDSFDTPETLAKKVLEVEHRLLVDTIKTIVGEWK